MGTRKVKEAEVKEGSGGEKGPAEVKEKAVSRKWKGKDWFTLVAPGMFGGGELGEVPATDPESLINRGLEVSLPGLGGNQSKYYVKLHFRVASVEGSKALTVFKGMDIAKEHMFRIVRKRTSRVEVVQDVKTNDGWDLHISILAILNRVSQIEIQKKVRARIRGLVEDFASKSTVSDFVNTVCDDVLQKNIKKFGSKIYPVRFCEVVKIEVRKAGKEPAKAAKAAA